MYSLKEKKVEKLQNCIQKLVKWEKRQKICRISRTETRKRKSTIITFRRFRIRLLFLCNKYYLAF
uniref:Uncharacterized protein n=1 Tax=Klebsiella pneumoniae TaxID=573 RepID=A0A8B0SV80_KLEPN|nr:hypothetical protein [Klebsiella pneumoniae]